MDIRYVAATVGVLMLNPPNIGRARKLPKIILTLKGLSMEHNRPETHEHYRRIREDPIYRLQEQMEELRVQRMPALSSFEPPEPEPEVIPEVHHIPVEPKAHMTRVRKLEEDLEGLRNYIVKNISQRTPQRKKDVI